MKKAYSYIRFSSKAQLEGRSLERQVDKARQYAIEHGLELQEVSYQDLGISGYRGKNVVEGALGDFIRAVESGHIEPESWLLVENFDRFSRLPVSQALAMLMQIVEMGIVLVTLTDRKVFKKDNLDMYALMASIVDMERAHSESRRKSEHLQDVWQAKRKRASERPVKSALPAWLKYNSDKTVIEVIEHKAKVVQMIFAMTNMGMGRVSIVRYFHENNILPIGKNSAKWHISYITKIVSGRAVLGEYQPHTRINGEKRTPIGDALKDYYPAVIDESTWLKAQANIEMRTSGSTGSQRKGINRNLFSGIGYCECGHKLTFVNKLDSRRGTKSYYLVCTMGRYGEGCQYIGHRYYEIQWVVLIALKNLLSTLSVNTELYAKEMELTGSLKDLQSRIEDIEKGLRDVGWSESLHKLLIEYEIKKKDIAASLESTKAMLATSQEPVDIEKLSRDINDPIQRLKLHQFLKRRIEAITVYKDRHRIGIQTKDNLKIDLIKNPETAEWTDGSSEPFTVVTI